MTVRHRIALAVGFIVLLTLLAFELVYYVEILSDPARDNYIVTERLPRALLLGTVAVGIAAGSAAWLAGTRALRPLTAIVSSAADLASQGDFARRFPEEAGDPEIAAVTRTFNGLIARVDQVLGMQRQLVEDTSHELKTPLTTIAGNLELLAHELPAADRREIVGETRQEVRRMARLVRELLLLAEAQPMPEALVKPVRLDLVVAEVAASTGADARRLAVRTEPTTIDGDPDRLRQLVGNLVQNALRFASPRPGAVQVTVAPSAGGVRLTVDDDGPGLPPAALERVFDRFYRVDSARDRAQGGSGLGLAIVRHIATAHAATSWAANREPRGARFGVEFPRRRPLALGYGASSQPTEPRVAELPGRQMAGQEAENGLDRRSMVTMRRPHLRVAFSLLAATLLPISGASAQSDALTCPLVDAAAVAQAIGSPVRGGVMADPLDPTRALDTGPTSTVCFWDADNDNSVIVTRQIGAFGPNGASSPMDLALRSARLPDAARAELEALRANGVTNLVVPTFQVSEAPGLGEGASWMFQHEPTLDIPSGGFVVQRGVDAYTVGVIGEDETQARPHAFALAQAVLASVP